MTLGRKVLLSIWLVFFAGQAMAFAPFVVEDIKVEGLQRISDGTVFNYLPIEKGDRIDAERTQQSISELYETGFFHDVQLLRDGDVLLVRVVERQSIANITIEGNDKIGGDDLLDALKNIGLAKGKIFDRALLDKIEQDLQRQYFSLGHYAVDVKSEVTDIDKNRVDVHIEIKEGDIAKIQQINLVGNTVFSEQDLLDEFELGTAPFFSWFSSRDQYSKPKLGADLEILRSYYLDRGYIKFDIDSTQVSITPDRSAVYVAINVSEGGQYSVSSVKLAGDLVVAEDELMALIDVAPKDVFSRRKLNQASSALADRLGQDGYAFANVNAVPDVDEENKTVGLTFFVDPGKRTYVRRINISGNYKTDDEVLRREMRQMESAWLSPAKVERSRVRIQRLSYLSNISVETARVANSTDQVDINISVNEEPSGSLMVGMGYSDGSGMLLNASVSQNNFMGTGKRVSAEVNTSKINTVYSFSHTDPYYTLHGVSRSLKAYYRKTDTARTTIARYTTNVKGTSVNFGIPMTEYDSFNIGLGYEDIKVNTGEFTPQSYVDYLGENGDQFGLTKLTLGWSRDTRNRTVFPTRGFMQSLSTELLSPGSGLEFYKVHSRTRWYLPVTRLFTFALNGELSYGEAYGDTSDLPFFEKYYAGGARSVRGYKANTLGPQDEKTNTNLGGNFRAVGKAELVFPPPFSPDSTTVRMSLFVDVGNVFDDINDYSGSQLRQSAGISLLWLSPLGPLSFNLAETLNEEAGDETETFQFTLGTFF